jgi:hypothetical protein
LDSFNEEDFVAARCFGVVFRRISMILQTNLTLEEFEQLVSSIFREISEGPRVGLLHTRNTQKPGIGFEYLIVEHIFGGSAQIFTRVRMMPSNGSVFIDADASVVGDRPINLLQVCEGTALSYFVDWLDRCISGGEQIALIPDRSAAQIKITGLDSLASPFSEAEMTRLIRAVRYCAEVSRENHGSDVDEGAELFSRGLSILLPRQISTNEIVVLCSLMFQYSEEEKFVWEYVWGSRGLGFEWKSWMANQTGVSFEAVLESVLVGASEVEIVDPYLIDENQIQNLLEVLRLIGKVGASGQKHVEVIIPKQKARNLLKREAEIRETCRELEIEFELSTPANADLHDRKIEADGLRSLHLSRGLDIFDQRGRSRSFNTYLIEY